MLLQFSLSSLQAKGMDEMVWRGLKQLYGRRKATRNFAKFMGSVLRDTCGIAQCTAAPHLFCDVRRGITLELHVEDYHACGPREKLVTHDTDNF